jgi:hypothetical protein
MGYPPRLVGASCLRSLCLVAWFSRLSCWERLKPAGSSRNFAENGCAVGESTGPVELRDAYNLQRVRPHLQSPWKCDAAVAQTMTADTPRSPGPAWCPRAREDLDDQGTEPNCGGPTYVRVRRGITFASPADLFVPHGGAPDPPRRIRRAGPAAGLAGPRSISTIPTRAEKSSSGPVKITAFPSDTPNREIRC